MITRPAAARAVGRFSSSSLAMGASVTDGAASRAVSARFDLARHLSAAHLAGRRTKPPAAATRLDERFVLVRLRFVRLKRVRAVGDAAASVAVEHEGRWVALAPLTGEPWARDLVALLAGGPRCVTGGSG